MVTAGDLVELFGGIVVEDPDRVFLEESNASTLSYGQSYHLSTKLLASRLCSICPQLSTPAQSQNRVVLISHNNTLFVLILWACWSLSTEVVLLSIDMDPSFWEAAINFLNPRLIITSHSTQITLTKQLPKDSDYEVLTVDQLIPESYRAGDSRLRRSDYIPSLLRWLADDSTTHIPEIAVPSQLPDRPAVTLFTSSAVDAQSLKCVTYTHLMLIRSGERTIEMFGGSDYQSRPVRHLGCLPLSHCFEFCISLIGSVLLTGGTYVFFDSHVSSPDVHLSASQGRLLLRAIQYHQPVDSLCTVPTFVEDMMKFCSPHDLNNLRAMRSLGVGGAPTPEVVFNWAVDQKIPYVDVSGATEAVGVICSRRALGPETSRSGLQMVAGLEGYLEKESEEDTYGELIIRSAHLPVNYTNFKSSVYSHDDSLGITTYRTGDIYDQSSCQASFSYVRGETVPTIRSLDDRLTGISYIGRRDDIVVLSSGAKIDALALERVYNAHEDVARTAVVSSIDRSAPVLLIQPLLPQGHHLTLQRASSLVDYVLRHNETLSFEKRVQKENVIFVDELPLTTKLTINRKKIKKIWTENNGVWPGRLSNRPLVGKPGRKSLLISHDTEEGGISLKLKTLIQDVFDIPREAMYGDQMDFLSAALSSSLAITAFAKALEDRFNVQVHPHQIYALRSIDDLCRLVGNEQGDRLTPPLSLRSDVSEETMFSHAQNSGDSLAITGMSCCFPGGVRSSAEFWSALLDSRLYKTQVSTSVPSSRWDLMAGVDCELPPVMWLDDDTFAAKESLAEFFHLSPQEIENMSPNARLALQLGYQAIEDAAIAPRSLSGKAWGVYTSVNDSGWREREAGKGNIRNLAQTVIGGADSAISGRLAYFLDLTGPAIEVKTACSSSAVAIHQACMGIRNGDCEAAIVVCSTTHFHPANLIFRAEAGIASMTGCCSPFTDAANGYVPSEGAAATVIQKAGDACCTPYGVIKASRVTQDGRSHGFFAPNPLAQTRLLTSAIDTAGCSPDDIDYIECHGTGTRTGDAVEIQAINDCFGSYRSRPLLVGSVKAVFGHNEECAGMTGLLKALLCIQENVIPPQPSFQGLNPDIDFSSSRVVVPRRIMAYPSGGRSKPRTIGVSSFGISGTLCHIILQEFAPMPAYQMAPSPLLFLISSNTLQDYVSLVRRYGEYTSNLHGLETDIHSICRTTLLGRDHLTLRRAFTVSDHRSLSVCLMKELSDPKPRSGIQGVKIGLWFGLPLNNTKSLELSDIYTKLTPALAHRIWAEQYTFFEQQLTVAWALKRLGCEIFAVGGEGMAELVAAVFAGILPQGSVFKGAPERDITDGRMFCAQLRKDILNDVRCRYTPLDLSLRGHHGGDLYSLKVSEAKCHEFERKHDVHPQRVSLLEASPCRPSLEVINPAVKIRFVSGHLGETLDPVTMSGTPYWWGVSSRYIDSPKAWNAMMQLCKVTVGIGCGREFRDHFGDRGACLEDGNAFTNVLGRLYEKGCSLKWQAIAGEGPSARLPCYYWT